MKLKDYVTLGNLVVALYAVEESFGGRIERATVFALVSWAFDAMDGLIARLTHSGNRFGAHLDDLVDHVAYTLAPAFIAFNAYAPEGRFLAFLLLFVIVSIGTIRLARFATDPLSFPGYWIGLPRPAFGFTLLFLLNSSLFRTAAGPRIGVGLVALMAGLSLTRLPYRNHKQPFTRGQSAALVSLLPGCVALYPVGQMWNAALLVTSLYLLAPWIALNSRERTAIAQTLARNAQAAVV